jgi:hypothetical protein
VFLVVERLAKGMAVPFRPHDLRRYAGYQTMPHFVRRHAPTWVGVAGGFGIVSSAQETQS